MFKAVITTQKNKDVTVTANMALGTVNLDGSVLTREESLSLIAVLCRAIAHLQEHGDCGYAFSGQHEAYGVGSLKKALSIQISDKTLWLIDVGGTLLSLNECKTLNQVLWVAANYCRGEVHHAAG